MKTKNNFKKQISVIGYAGLDQYPEDTQINEKNFSLAYEIGFNLAKTGCIVITGGESGIMLEANRGCKDARGISIAVTSDLPRFGSNKYVDIEIPVAADFVAEQIMKMSDACVILGGGVGTLMEITYAYRLQIPMFSLKGLGGWSGRLESIEYLDERKKSGIKYFDTINSLMQEICQN